MRSVLSFDLTILVNSVVISTILLVTGCPKQHPAKSSIRKAEMWERVDPAGMTYAYRTKVPGGWIFVVGATTTFIDDPGHTWGTDKLGKRASVFEELPKKTR